MGFRSLLGADLSGKLRAWRKRYKSSHHTFDYSRVECAVPAQGASWKVIAVCYCSDPGINGFDMSEVARVYASRPFPSRVEAEAHLDAEVRNAMLRHPDAGFYRYREVDYLNDGTVQAEPLLVYEHYDGTRWIQADFPTGARRCENCAFTTDAPICPQCGGLTT